jgi:plasmid stabilization system protein ParE
VRVRYTPRAFADREAIFDYLESRSPQGARNVQHAIVQSVRLLAEYPRLGRRTDKPDVYG